MRATAPFPRVSLRSRKAAVAGVTAAGLLIAGGGAALAANPPQGPGNIEIFSKRDMIMIDGYTAQAGETATFTLKRGDRVVGTASGVVDENGFLEVNHPGGACWTGVTPDVRGGDLVEVSFSETEFVDGAHVGDVVVTAVTPQATAEETADPDDIEGQLVIEGTYGDFVDPARFGVEIVNPDMRGREGQPTRILERAIGFPADPTDLPTGYTVDGVVENGQFTVTFGFYSHFDLGLAAAGEHVAMSWLAEPTNGVEAQFGLTMYEFGEFGGPGFGECPPGPSAQAPDAPLNLSASGGGPGTGTITATWDPAGLPPDAADVSRYELRAKDPEFAGQETVVTTAGDVTTATLNRLVEQPHQLRVVAYNAAGASVDSNEITVDPSSTATVPVPADPDATDPDGGTVGDTEIIDPPGGGGSATAPAAPTGVTAALGGTAGEATVSFAAPADSAVAVTGFEVSATTSTDGVTAPETQVLAADATTATVTGLVEGASYTFSVVALGAGATEGEVVRSPAATATLTVPAVVAPNAPRVVRVSTGSGSAFVEWSAATAGNADSPVTGYRLTATPGTGGDPVVLGDIPATATSATLANLANGTQYTLELVATSAGGDSAPASFANGVSSTIAPADVLTATAEFRTDRTEWRLNGTASVATGNTVTATTVATNGATRTIGSAAVAADGSWTLRVRNSGITPRTPAQVSITSSAGGSVTVPVTVR